MPSRLLINIVLVDVALCTLSACLPIPVSATARFAAAGTVLLIVLTALDFAHSHAQWRPAPLQLRRRLPQAFAVGVPVTVQLNLENPAASRRRGEIFDYSDPSIVLRGMPLHFDIGPGQRAEFNVSLTPTARGLRQFAPAQLRLRSQWGLLDFNRRVGDAESRRVFPNFAAQARYAWLAGEKRLPSAGIKSVQRRGAGTDFDQLVDYQPGDPIRHIDWKATGKLGRPIVRKFRDERDQSVMILLDCGRRMRADEDGRTVGGSHFDQALNAAMLLAFVALSHGDAVGAMTFGSPPGQEKRFSPRKGRHALNALMAALADIEPSSTFSDYELAAVELLQRQRKRALIVVITNSRNEDAPELSAALRLLRARHLVVLANLREEVIASIVSQPLSSSEKALECAAALEYEQTREVLLARVAEARVLAIDCEPTRLAVELINRYTILKRSGSI